VRTFPHEQLRGARYATSIPIPVFTICAAGVRRNTAINGVVIIALTLIHRLFIAASSMIHCCVL
jgi:hypothetical protein